MLQFLLRQLPPEPTEVRPNTRNFDSMQDRNREFQFSVVYGHVVQLLLVTWLLI